MRVAPITYFQKLTDADADAFLSAAGITDPVIVEAVTSLVISLKTTGLWGKMIAVYPFVGGTEAAHKFNLLNPANTDAAYRLTFTTRGGSTNTHSSLGYEAKNNAGFGANANTYIKPNSVTTAGDEHFSIYVNSNFSQTSGDPVAGGAFDSATAVTLLVPKLGTDYVVDQNKYAVRMNDNTKIGSTTTTTAGFMLVTRNSTTINGYRNDILDVNTSTGGTLATNSPIWIGGLNINNGTNTYGGMWIRFATVTYGKGLNATDATNLYSAIQSFNIKLNRAY